MNILVMYKSEKSGALFCLGKDWDKVKRGLSGQVNYMKFTLKERTPLAIARKICECQQGQAHPVSGGSIWIK
jgi:hypothetical protein